MIEYSEKSKEVDAFYQIINNMRNIKRALFILVSVTVIAACSPVSKESYLEKYDDFATDVSENYKTYTEKDWKKAAKKHEKFSGEWYNKFENEFSLKDKVKIKSNQAKWYYYRNLGDVTSAVMQLFDSFDVKGMKKQIQYYVDNDMQNELQKIYKDAIKAGKAAEETIVEILNELNVKIDE